MIEYKTVHLKEVVEVVEMTVEDVRKHNKKDDCWLIINRKVYDLTGFLKFHPPGGQSILNYGGTDASQVFQAVHDVEMLDRLK